MKDIKRFLEKVYGQYHRREFVHPDPLEFLYRYNDRESIEVVGLISAGLALGRVSAIISNLEHLFDEMGDPLSFVLDGNRSRWLKRLKGFTYRFYTEEHLTDLLEGMQRCIRNYGSLESCFLSGFRNGGVQQGLSRIYQEIYSGKTGRTILPDPGKKSAAKRLHLYLRWMVRKDCIDPGVWDISPAHLLVPVDTHMLQAAKLLRFTDRRQADLVTAEAITGAFRAIDPDDPVRFDFSLTRMGIHPDLTGKQLLDFAAGSVA